MKVLYYGWLRSNFPLLKKMQKSYGWEPTVISATTAEKDKVTRHFPDATFVDAIDLRFGKCNYSHLKKIPIGQKEYFKIGQYNINFINFFASRDTTGHNFSTSQKIYFSKKIFDFWNSLLFSKDIDCVVFYTWPHTSTDYSLYLIAKFIFKKKILFIDAIEHFNKFYHTIGFDLEDMSAPYTKYLNEDHNNKDVENYINNVKNNSGNFLRSDHYRFRKTYNDKFLIINLLFKFLFSILKGGFFRKDFHGYKNSKKSYNKRNRQSVTSSFFYKFMVAIKTMYSKIIFEKNSTKINSKNFLIFCAQYQPEAQTVQLNDYYQDIFAILDLIYSCIDENTDVYFKEHPCTFAPLQLYNSTHYRNKYFFKKLSKYKNLKLLSLNSKLNECVKNAKAVVTMNSTSGVESLILGKPVLLFGRSWYEKCDGVFKIQDYNDCKKAFEKINSGFTPNFNKVKAYLNSVALSCDKNIVHDDTIRHSEKDNSDFVENISKLLHKKYLEYYN